MMKGLRMIVTSKWVSGTYNVVFLKFAKWSSFETLNILSNDIATSVISQSRDFRVSETELQSLMLR